MLLTATEHYGAVMNRPFRFGRYLASLYSPVTGLSSPAIRITGGEKPTIGIPNFRHDIVVRIVRA